MPPFLGALFYAIVALVCLAAALVSQLPTAKEWSWTWFGASKASKAEKEDLGIFGLGVADLFVRLPCQVCAH